MLQGLNYEIFTARVHVIQSGSLGVGRSRPICWPVIREADDLICRLCEGCEVNEVTNIENNQIDGISEIFEIDPVAMWNVLSLTQYICLCLQGRTHRNTLKVPVATERFIIVIIILLLHYSDQIKSTWWQTMWNSKLLQMLAMHMSIPICI